MAAPHAVKGMRSGDLADFFDAHEGLRPQTAALVKEGCESVRDVVEMLDLGDAVVHYLHTEGHKFAHIGRLKAAARAWEGSKTGSGESGGSGGASLEEISDLMEVCCVCVCSVEFGCV